MVVKGQAGAARCGSALPAATAARNASYVCAGLFPSLHPQRTTSSAARTTANSSTARLTRPVPNAEWEPSRAGRGRTPDSTPTDRENEHRREWELRFRGAAPPHRCHRSASAANSPRFQPRQRRAHTALSLRQLPRLPPPPPSRSPPGRCPNSRPARPCPARRAPGHGARQAGLPRAAAGQGGLGGRRPGRGGGGTARGISAPARGAPQPPRPAPRSAPASPRRGPQSGPAPASACARGAPELGAGGLGGWKPAGACVSPARQLAFARLDTPGATW